MSFQEPSSEVEGIGDREEDFMNSRWLVRDLRNRTVLICQAEASWGSWHIILHQDMQAMEAD